jgi:hypothetical protein
MGFRAEELKVSVLFEESRQMLLKGPRIPHVAFPQRKYVPTVFSPDLLVLSVPSLVPRELWTPIFCTGLRDVGIDATLVLMPEATPHVDDLFESTKHKIRLAGKFTNMQPESKAHGVSHSPHN